MEKNPKDPKYLGVPNICFSLTSEDDDREEDFSIQRIVRGFDDSETWSLRDTIGNFILPRLKRFKEIHINVDESFDEALDKSIRAFELLIRERGSFILNEEEKKEYNEGMQAFHDVFLGLWW